MGVIRRQSLKFSLVNFAGTLIGALSILFVYPLNDELYGYANYLYSVATLFIPLASFGMSSLVIRYFREFKNNSDNNGLLSLVLVLSLALNVVFFLAYFVFKNMFYGALEAMNMDSSLLKDNEFVVLSLILLLNLLMVVGAFISNYKRIVVPTLVQTLGYKLYLPGVFLITYFGYVSVKHFSFLIPIFYLISLILLTIYLGKLGGFSLKWRPKVYRKKIGGMINYLMYSGLTGLGSSLIFKIDSVMVSMISGLASNGLYNRIFFMANVINIPTASITQISNPIISECIENDNWGEIEDIYRRSSSNLFLVGAYLFVLMMFCLPVIFGLSSNPESYKGAMQIFVFLGAAKLIDMVTSINSAIISFSKYYRVNLIFILLLGVLNIVLNYYLINAYGVQGAALASMISLFVFNLTKYFFIWAVFKIQPFTAATLKILGTFGVLFFTLFWLKLNINPVVDVLIYSTIISGIALGLVLFGNVSPDARSVVVKYMRKLKIPIS